ncbi:MAG: alpha/beta fold hydrolase [Acidobacteriota bacterium]
MTILAVSAFLGLVTALVSGLIWLIARFGWRRRIAVRRLLKQAGISFAVSLPLVLFLVLPVLMSYLIAHASTRPMDQRLTENPATFGRTYRDVEFQSRDGVRLRGWFLPGDGARTPIVLAHGLFRDRHEVLARACELNLSGFPALLFDFRSHGTSGKAPITLGYSERLDVLAAEEYIMEKTGTRRVALLGVSMGATACALAASEHPATVTALVADSAFASLESTVRRHVHLFLGLPSFPFSNVFIWNLCRIGHFQPQDLDVLTALEKMPTVPVLLIYGRDDTRMPPEVARELLAATADPNRELWMVDNAGHGAAYRTAPREYLKHVITFLSVAAGE